MDIHKPKPWHGVREFLKEYVIIVVGVLTALAGEQAVEWSHRQREVGEAREALRAEIERDLTIVEGNVRQDTCMRRFLPRLEAWAQNGGPRPAGASFVYNGLASTAWDIAKTGAVAQMP